MDPISNVAKSARNCLMCSTRCREPTPLLKSEVVGAVHNNHLQRQLQHLFIIRQLLEIPAHWCELTLQRFDGKYDPSRWFRICQKCIPKVDRAWNIYQQLLSLESEMKAIKEQIKYKMQRNFEKSKGMRGIDNEICSLIFPALVEESQFSDRNQNSALSAKNVTNKADAVEMFQEDSFFGTGDSLIDDFFESYLSDDENPPLTKRKKRTKEQKVVGAGNSAIVSRKNWCTLCPAKLTTEEELEAHMKVHEESQRNGRPFECQHCSFPASSSEQLESHILEFHVKSNVPIRTHACPYCKFSAKAWKALKVHVDEQHSSETSGSDFELRCVPCNKLFECRSSFLVHQKKIHPENFGFAKEEISCDQCSRKFHSRLHLEYHIRNTHDRVTNFVCEICAKGFRTAVALNRHKVTHQENKRQHICHLCGCDYSHESILVLHYKKEHPGSISSDGRIDTSATDTAETGEEFRCKYCEVTSPYKLVMLRHMETHKAEMGHQCDICQKFYTNAGGLKRHKRINHPATSQGVNCPYCLKNFTSQDYMKSHITKYCKLKTLSEAQQIEVQVEDTN